MRSVPEVKIGDHVHVRKPSMHRLDYQDCPGIVVQVNDAGSENPTYNVEREDGIPVANGQPVCGPSKMFGIVVTGSEEWLRLNVL